MPFWLSKLHGKMVAAAMKGAHLQLWKLTFETEFAREESADPSP